MKKLLKIKEAFFYNITEIKIKRGKFKDKSKIKISKFNKSKTKIKDFIKLNNAFY